MVSVTVIATVRDEAASIDVLLSSLLAGRRLPDEIVIVDGGSTDGTCAKLLDWSRREPRLRLLSLPGSGRSAGRNAAITAARAPWIAVTDGGVRLDPSWLAELLTPVETEGPAATGDGHNEQPPDVIAGFFRMDPATLFELALGATTLPTAREIRPARFLPSSRSVLFSRAAWAAAGGYPEWLDYGEDLVFDLALRRAGARFAWAPGAVAHFRPRSTLVSFFRQYYRYARGDGKAGLWPRRHAVRYAAYAALPALLWSAIRPRARWTRRLAAVAIATGAAAYLHAPYARLLWPAAGVSGGVVMAGELHAGHTRGTPDHEWSGLQDKAPSGLARFPQFGRHGMAGMTPSPRRGLCQVGARTLRYASPSIIHGRVCPPGITDWLLLVLLVPILRFTGDLAKMLGYPAGCWWRPRHRQDIPSDPTAPARRLDHLPDLPQPAATPAVTAQ